MCINPENEQSCCKRNGFTEGCEQGKQCPHWGRVSQKVVCLRGPLPKSPLGTIKAVEPPTKEQVRDMDDTMGPIGFVPGTMFMPDRLFAELDVALRKRVGGIDWLSVMRFVGRGLVLGVAMFLAISLAISLYGHVSVPFFMMRMP